MSADCSIFKNRKKEVEINQNESNQEECVVHECVEGHSYGKNDLCEVAAKQANMRAWAYDEYEETGKTHKELVKTSEKLNEIFRMIDLMMNLLLYRKKQKL